MPAYDKAKLQAMIARAEKARSKTKKGKALEDLAIYLFSKIPGLKLSARDQKNVFDTEEIDVAFWNEQEPDGLKALDETILAECKNWSVPVGSIEVNWFLSKIEERGQRFGILLAMNGITGNASDLTAAHKIVANFLRKRVQMVLITKDDILKLNTSEELVEMIKLKICQLVVAGTICQSG